MPPPSAAPVFMQLDIAAALDISMLSVILTLLLVDVFDTAGTLVAVATRANLVDKDGNLPRLGKALLADSGATAVGALLGTSSTTSYIESAAGVESGGRTGLTAVVVGLLFSGLPAVGAIGPKQKPCGGGGSTFCFGVHGAKSGGYRLARRYRINPSLADRYHDAAEFFCGKRHRHRLHQLRVNQTSGQTSQGGSGGGLCNRADLRGEVCFLIDTAPGRVRGGIWFALRRKKKKPEPEGSGVLFHCRPAILEGVLGSWR